MAVDGFEFLKNLKRFQAKSDSSPRPSSGPLRVSPEKSTEPAWRSYMEAHPDTLNRRLVSPEKYREFMANQDFFRDMVDDWATVDDPDTRGSILDSYTNKYGFDKNPIFNDLLQGLRNYDYGHKTGDNKDSAMKRLEWNSSMYENLDAAASRFNPFRRV